jgi:type II secretory pathway pseudopilin PulG
MAALLVALGVMAVMLTVALPAWRQMVQREKEAELIFRGQQYVRAIGLFQRKYAASFPPDVDTLLSQKFLRKKYKDPMTADGEFQVLYQMSAVQPGQAGRPGSQPPGRGGTSGSTPQTSAGVQGSGAFNRGTLGPRGGMIGVASKSTDTSIRLYNGRSHYNEWQFIFAPAMVPGQGQGRPGMPGLGGRGMGPGGIGPGGMGGRGGPGGRGMGPGGMGGRERGEGPGGRGRGEGPGGQPFPFPQGGRGGRGPGGNPNPYPNPDPNPNPNPNPESRS